MSSARRQQAARRDVRINVQGDHTNSEHLAGPLACAALAGGRVATRGRGLGGVGLEDGRRGRRRGRSKLGACHGPRPASNLLIAKASRFFGTSNGCPTADIEGCYKEDLRGNFNGPQPRGKRPAPAARPRRHRPCDSPPRYPPSLPPPLVLLLIPRQRRHRHCQLKNAKPCRFVAHWRRRRLRRRPQEPASGGAGRCLPEIPPKESRRTRSGRSGPGP